METLSYKGRINLAIKAIKKNPKLKNQVVVKIYNINKNTLWNQRAGQPTRRDILANSYKLTNLEKNTII
jgi:hypothetical protein